MRFGVLDEDGNWRLVSPRDGGVIDLQSSDPGLPGDVREVLADLETHLPRLRAAAATGTVREYDPKRLLPAVPDPGKVLCIGRNYAAHAEELGHPVPARWPEVFLRTRTSLLGPYGDLTRPRASDTLDYEVELAAVVGRRARHVGPDEALSVVAAYCVFNDASVRAYQLNREQWTPGKNFDGTGPLGPFLVTADEVQDPHALELVTEVVREDGGVEELQRSSTSLLLFRLPQLISFITEWTTLEPGDVIATGTPPGVGAGRTPPRWLRPGETLISRITGLGELRNRVVDEGS